MSYIELNKSAFFHNLDIIAKKTGDTDKIALVLKDNAYGHGLTEVSRMAKEYGVSRAVIRSEAEAEQIKDFFTYILVLSPAFPVKEDSGFVYTVNSLDDIQEFPKSTRVELKVDTGMHRNGVSIDEVADAVCLIENKGLILEGVFTHYRSADTMSAEWFWQKKTFQAIRAKYPKLRTHSCNSAGFFRDNNFDEDMVRIGIAAYGCLQLDRGFEETGLKPVLSLTAEKISTRLLKEGERIGYNATYEAKEDMVVSNYDIGYADGFPRLLSNTYMTPDGNELLGRVSMDNSSYSSEKERLLVFDDANEIASYAGTIAYEILTSLSPVLKRHII